MEYRWQLQADCTHKPDAEAFERVRAEGHADSDVGSICDLALSAQVNAGVITRIERVPGSPHIRFKPTCKIHRRIRPEYTSRR